MRIYCIEGKRILNKQGIDSLISVSPLKEYKPTPLYIHFLTCKECYVEKAVA